MKWIRQNKTVFLNLLTLVYSFVLAFSSQLHHHDTEHSHDDIHVKTCPKHHFSAKKTHEVTDCLACFVFHHSHSELPNTISFKLLTFETFYQPFFAYKQRFANVTFDAFYLRGPPTLV